MVMADLTLTLHREDTRVALAVTGELDLSTRDSLIGAAVGAMRPGDHLELDLTDVTFCDSLGISALVAIRNIASSEAATMVVTGAGAQVSQVLRTTGLLDALTSPTGGGHPAGGLSAGTAERREGLVGVGVHPDLAADDLDDPLIGADHERHPLGLVQAEPALDAELIAHDAVRIRQERVAE
jgi:anti-anti-sigma factor